MENPNMLLILKTSFFLQRKEIKNPKQLQAIPADVISIYKTYYEFGFSPKLVALKLPV